MAFERTPVRTDQMSSRVANGTESGLEALRSLLARKAGLSGVDRPEMVSSVWLLLGTGGLATLSEPGTADRSSLRLMYARPSKPFDLNSPALAAKKAMSSACASDGDAKRNLIN